MKQRCKTIKEKISSLHFSIGQKLILVFISVLMIFSVSLLFTFRLLEDINDTHKRLTNDGIAALAQAKSVSDGIIRHGFELRNLIRNNITEHNKNPEQDIDALNMHLENLRKNIEDLEKTNILLEENQDDAKSIFANIRKNYLNINDKLFRDIPQVKNETDILRQEIRKTISQIEIKLKRFKLKNKNQFFLDRIDYNLDTLEATSASFHYNFSKQEIQRSRSGYTEAIASISNILAQCAQKTICQEIALLSENLLKHTSHTQGYFFNLLTIRSLLDKAKHTATKIEKQNITLNGYISSAIKSKNYRLQEKIDHLSKSIFSGKVFVIASIIIVLVISLSVLFLFIIPFITSRIRTISAQTYNIANGNLDIKIEPQGHDEITQISEALEYFRKQLITKKEIEDEREKLVEDLLSSNQELKRFAYICSHDLQEPARMVGVFSQKILDKYSDFIESDEKLKRYFHFVHDGGIRMQKMIQDILNYSSISATAHATEQISLNEIIDNQINYFKNIDSNVIIKRDNLPDIQGHETRFMQIFQNLIGNGIKYQKSDVIPEINVSYTENNEDWTFSVTDNGIGIREENLEKIFDIFTRLHRRDEYVGTGIGLAVCYKIVTSYGGKIWAESKVGQGTTFFFTLPKISK